MRDNAAPYRRRGRFRFETIDTKSISRVIIREIIWINVNLELITIV